MIRVYEIDGTFLGQIGDSPHPGDPTIYNHYRTENYPNSYRDLYSRSMERIGYLLEFSPRWGRHFFFDSKGSKVGEVEQRVGRLLHGKPGVTISSSGGVYMSCDIDGNFWKRVGHSRDLDHMPVQKLGYLRDSRDRVMMIPPEKLDKVAGAGFLLVNHFYQQSYPGREPLWMSVDQRYFRCKPGECVSCDYHYRATPNWKSNYMVP